ncbi:MAG: DUF3524 domain-containing protein [Actinomycetota bacterium]
MNTASAVNALKLLIVEPWFDGSHRRWAEGYQQASSHDVHVLGLPGELWRWRLRGGAVPLADLIQTWMAANGRPDVLMVSGLVDVSQLLGLTRRHLNGTPVVVYQHESQLLYPTQSAVDQDSALHNWLSWLAADEVWFNSPFHMYGVIERLEPWLEQLPDKSHLPKVDEVTKKFVVEPVGVDVQGIRNLPEVPVPPGPPVILWPHRWEADKDPEAFGNALMKVAQAGHEFGLILAGEDPAGFSGSADEARQRIAQAFGARVLAVGPFDHARYRMALARADIVVSCAKHEFFGIAVVEAIAAGCVPVLPRALSYPDLIPRDWHEAVLYEPGTFGTALTSALVSFTHRKRATAGLAGSMERYDWPVIARRYDERLLALREQPRRPGR